MTTGAAGSPGQLPAVAPSLWRAATVRRRPDWRSAPRVEVAAEGIWLDPARVDAFVGVCGGAEPPTLPLTFPAALLTPLHLALVTHPDFALSPIGLVHKAEHIERARAMATGTRCDVVAYTDGYRQTPSGVEVVMVTELRQGGELTWSSRSRLVRREGASGGPRPYVGDAPRTGGRTERVVVPAGIGRSYGFVSGNLDPIHVSAWTARLFGHRHALVHGMWTAARIVAALGDPMGDATLDVAFRAPVSAPSTLKLVSVPIPGGQRFAAWPERGVRPAVEGTLTTSAAGPAPAAAPPA